MGRQITGSPQGTPVALGKIMDWEWGGSHRSTFRGILGGRAATSTVTAICANNPFALNRFGQQPTIFGCCRSIEA